MESDDLQGTWSGVIEEKERDGILNAMGSPCGQGACSVIYTLDALPGEVLKEIRTDMLPSHVLEGMEAALCTLSRLKHPNLPECKRAFRVSDYLYLQVTRYHGSLESLMRLYRRRKQSMPRRLILEVVRQISSALAYLHDPDKTDPTGAYLPMLVHGGIKPANILVDRAETHFVLADTCVSTEAFRRHLSMYAPPEVLLGEEPTPASDLWSLGAVLYEMSTGSKPVAPDGRRVNELLEKGLTPDLSGVKDVVIRGILEHILVLDPRERISARELACIVDLDAKELALVSLLETRSLKKEVRVLQEQLAVMQRSTASKTASRPVISSLLGMTELMQASANGDTNAVRALVDAGSDLRAKGPSGMTALMHASSHGHVAVVRLLVDHEAQMQDDKSRTALMLAAQNGRVNVLRILLEHESCMQDSDGWTALMYAAHWGHLEAAQLLLRHEAKMKDRRCQTALMLAAGNGNIPLVRLLGPLEAGFQDKAGQTALMRAASKGHVGAVQLLLEHEKGLCDATGKTALGWASEFNRSDAVRILELCPQESTAPP